VIDGAHDPDRVGGEVNVTDTECEHLAHPQAREGRDERDRRVPFRWLRNSFDGLVRCLNEYMPWS
jgi:hypothetical protein